jgi:hypothetical protein
VVLDNLKSGVVKPDLHDPRIHLAYAELERHYGVVADPAKVRKPRHKRKVERGVPVIDRGSDACPDHQRTTKNQEPIAVDWLLLTF